MNDRRRILFTFLAGMTTVSLLVGALAIWTLYRAAITECTEQLQLAADMQARLIEAVARFDQSHHPTDAAAATMSQIADGYRHARRFGQTDELVLGRHKGDKIEFLLERRFGQPGIPETIGFDSSDWAEPMRRALSGQRDWMIGRDYRGRTVLAAYEPIDILGYGLVVKQDLAEIRAPFVRAGLIAVGVAVVVIAVGGLVGLRVTSPLIERIERSEQRYALAQKAANVGTWSWDVATGNVDWSEQVESMFGFGPGEFDGTYEAYQELIHPDDRAWVLEKIGQTVERGEHYEIEHRIVRPDGAVAWIEAGGDVVWNESGGVIGMMGVVHDVTDRKQAEKALERSEAFLNATGRMAKVGGWEIDAATSDMRWTEAMYHVFDLPPDKKVGVDEAIELFRPEDQRKLRHVIGRALEHGEPYDLEVQLTTPKGRHRWTHVICTPVVADGKVVMLKGTFQDITEHKETERALSESERLLASTFEQSPYPKWIADERGTLVRINEACCRMLNVTPDEVVGKYNVLEDNIVEEQGFMPRVRGVFEKGEPANFEIVYHTSQLKQLDLKGSSFTILDVSMAPVRDADGRMTNVVIQHQDITARRKAERALQESEERFRGLFENSPYGIVFCELIEDDQGRAVDYVHLQVNPAGGELAGGHVGDLLGRRALELVPPEEIAESIKRYEQAVSTGTAVHFTQHYPFVGRTYDMTAYPLKGKLFVLVFSDVTEQHRAEEALRQSELKHRQIFESNLLGVLYCDGEGNISEANDTFLRMVGYTAEDVTAGRLRWTDITPPEYEPVDRRAIEEILAKGYCTPFEKEYVRKDGSRFPVLVGSSATAGSDTEGISFVLDITERKQAEQQLQESEERFRGLFENAPIGIALCELIEDDQGRAVDYVHMQINPAAGNLVGGRVGDLVGKRALELVAPEELAESVEQFAQAVSSGTAVHFTQHYPSIGYTFDFTAYPLKDKLFVIMCSDVTEREKVQQLLREQEALLNEVGTIAKIGGWEMDVIARKATWTRGTYDIVEIGYDQPVPGPDEHLDYYLPEFRPLVAESMRALVEEDKPLDFEAKLRTAKGNVKWCRAIGRAERKDGQCVRIYGTFQDVTERKQAEEALRKERDFSQTLVQASPTFFVAIDAQGKTMMMNSSMLDALGYEAEDVTGTDYVETFVPEADRESLVSDVFRRLADEKESTVNENRIRARDGRELLVEWHGSPVVGSDGNLEYFFGVGIDITERRQAEEALQTAQRELLARKEREKELAKAELSKVRAELIKKTRLATLGQLTATVSHEIRNPLGSIRTAVYSVAQSVGGHDALVDRALDRAERNIIRCDQIIEELLDYTRTRESNLVATPIDSWLDGLLDEQEILEGVSVVRNLDSGAMVSTDRDQLRRCVVNLLTNAVQAMAGLEGGAARLTIETSVDADQVLVKVSDTGCGIAPKSMEKIFEPLFTTKGFGVGLGLPMVEQLMRQLGGRVAIESLPGEGTTATLYLPSASG